MSDKKKMDLKSFKGGSGGVLIEKEAEVKKTAGRKKTAEEKRTEVVHLYLTLDEKKRLEEKAGLIPLTAFVRDLIKNHI